jgi:hypothetical protein
MGMISMTRRLVSVATFVGLSGAIGLSLVWMLVAHGIGMFEASTQMLGLTAALTGIVAERFAAERQRRRLALATITDELIKNRTILGTLLFTLGKAPVAKKRVYPRLLVSAADGAITSGALAHDRELFAMLHEWRNEVSDFNRRLDLTEMLTFLQGTPEAIRGFEQALCRGGGRVYRISRLLQDFLDYLGDNYRDETPPSRLKSEVPAAADAAAVSTGGTAAASAATMTAVSLGGASQHTTGKKVALEHEKHQQRNQHGQDGTGGEHIDTRAELA